MCVRKTYVYQSQSLLRSLRLAPVRPDTGMNVKSEAQGNKQQRRMALQPGWAEKVVVGVWESERGKAFDYTQSPPHPHSV